MLTIVEARLVSATGKTGARLFEMLGNGLGCQIAELGIGTYHSATVISAIREDEKAYGTAHVACWSNHAFGGTLDAGVHIAWVVPDPIIEWLPEC